MQQPTFAVLSAETAKAISDFAGKQTTANGAKIKAVDLLISAGLTSADLEAPKQGATETRMKLWTDLKSAVVMGFNVTVQKTLVADTKTLSDQAKSDKRYWQQQIGSRIKDLRAAMKRRESDGENGPTGSTMESRLDSVLSDWIKRLEKAESAGFDLVEMVKRLKSAKSLIK